MYTKTALQQRLGDLDGLWMLQTPVGGTVETCYFFGMKGLVYQARLIPCKFGPCLVQVEKLPEDVEALELPVPAGTEVKHVLLENVGECHYLALVLAQGVLRYKMEDAGLSSAVSMGYTKESTVEEPAELVEICGYEHPEIPLPQSVFWRNMAIAALCCMVFLAGGVLLEQGSPVTGGILLALGLAALALYPFYPLYRCPYCRQAAMRSENYHPNVLGCPHCGEICRCRNPLAVGRKRRL